MFTPTKFATETGISMFIRRSTDPSHRAPRGQALAEFAMILPILLGLVGAGVDFSRGYAASMTLQTATRNAAEAAAYDATTPAEAQTIARTTVCTEAQRLPGFVPGTGGDVATCTQPSVTATWNSNADAPGANDGYPLVTVTVATSLDFGLTVPWPLLPNGTWTLGTTESFSIMQNR
jgi:Flp pilus assembly protein TadG